MAVIEEWLAYLRDNAPELYEQALRSIKSSTPWHDQRIAELETEVARLKADNKLLLDKLYNADRVHQNLLLSAERPIHEAEAKLKAVGELPRRWRQNANESIGLFADPDKHAAIFDCAAELEALLKKEVSS